MLIQLLRLIKHLRPRTPRRAANVLANNRRKELAKPGVNPKHHVFRAGNLSTPSTLSPRSILMALKMSAKREKGILKTQRTASMTVERKQGILKTQKTSSVTVERDQGIQKAQKTNLVTVERDQGIPKAQKASSVTVEREGIPNTQKTSSVAVEREQGFPKAQNRETSTVTGKSEQRIP